MQTASHLEAADRFIAGFEDDASQEGVEQLLAQLRSAIKARQAMLRSLDETVLPGIGAGRQVEVLAQYGQLIIKVSDRRGNCDELIKRYECPASWSRAWFHPAHWHLHRERIDSTGNCWRATCGTYVTDDFGNLVEVTA